MTDLGLYYYRQDDKLIVEKIMMGSPCQKYVSTSSHHSFISFYYAPQLLIYLHLGYLLPLQFSFLYFYSLGRFCGEFLYRFSVVGR